MKISGAIFDLDGTLTDSMGIWVEMSVSYIVRNGHTPVPNTSRELANMTMAQVCDYYCQTYGEHTTVEEMSAEVYRIAREKYENDVLPKPGIIDVLEDFRRRGIKMCVASMTPRELVYLTLKKNAMLDYFEDILSCETIGAGKDDPLIFEMALDILRTPKTETPVFEDTLSAAQTAKAAGFPIVGVYDRYSPDVQEQLKALSDIYVENYSPRLFS